MLDKITFIKMNNYEMILILKSISKKERNLYIFINQSINRTNFINYYNNNLHILLFSHFCSRDVEFCSNAAHHQHNAIWWIPSFRPISTIYFKICISVSKHLQKMVIMVTEYCQMQIKSYFANIRVDPQHCYFIPTYLSLY